MLSCITVLLNSLCLNIKDFRTLVLTRELCLLSLKVWDHIVYLGRKYKKRYHNIRPNLKKSINEKVQRKKPNNAINQKIEPHE